MYFEITEKIKLYQLNTKQFSNFFVAKNIAPAQWYSLNEQLFFNSQGIYRVVSPETGPKKLEAVAHLGLLLITPPHSVKI